MTIDEFADALRAKGVDVIRAEWFHFDRTPGIAYKRADGRMFAFTFGDTYAPPSGEFPGDWVVEKPREIGEHWVEKIAADIAGRE